MSDEGESMAKKRTSSQTRAVHFAVVRESVRHASDRVTQARSETSKVVPKSVASSTSRASRKS